MWLLIIPPTYKSLFNRRFKLFNDDKPVDVKFLISLVKLSNGWAERYIPTTSLSFLSLSRFIHSSQSGIERSDSISIAPSPNKLIWDEFIVSWYFAPCLIAFSKKLLPSLSMLKYWALLLLNESNPPAKTRFSKVFLFANLRSILFAKSSVIS